MGSFSNVQWHYGTKGWGYGACLTASGNLTVSYSGLTVYAEGKDCTYAVAAGFYNFSVGTYITIDGHNIGMSGSKDVSAGTHTVSVHYTCRSTWWV